MYLLSNDIHKYLSQDKNNTLCTIQLYYHIHMLFEKTKYLQIKIARQCSPFYVWCLFCNRGVTNPYPINIPTVLNVNCSSGQLKLHLTEVYLDEITLISTETS